MGVPRPAYPAVHGAGARAPGAARALMLAIVLGTMCGALPARAATPSARELLDRVDDLFRGRSSHGRATMVVATAHWTRTLTLEAWSKGKEQSLIRILAPEIEKILQSFVG
mgnify:CR=1 FL=1